MKFTIQHARMDNDRIDGKSRAEQRAKPRLAWTCIERCSVSGKMAADMSVVIGLKQRKQYDYPC
jgi:hypothetical protein